MTVRQIYFVGLLQNVDSSILKVKLENNFRFNSITKSEGIELFSVLENLPWHKLITKLFMDYPCLNPNLEMFFIVENSFNSDLFNNMSKFNNELVAHLSPKIRLMRLFKEGNIGMPLQYYFLKDPLTSLLQSSEQAYISSRSCYSLSDVEIDQLQNFLEKTNLPFKHKYIQLAFENFELSYKVDSPQLAFLTLMNGLEASFNPVRGEIIYRLSRNCAVLLGKNKQDADEIYRNVKNLYDLRSSIVHGGKVNVEGGKIFELRGYLRESIKKLYILDKPKEEVLKNLNESGFGEQA